MTTEVDEREKLLAFVREKSPVCPACGGELGQMSENKCPTCGRELVLAVVTALPFQRVWIASTILLFANAGIGVLFGLAWLASIQQHEHLPPMRQYAFIWWYLACIPLALTLLMLRAPFLRMPRMGQWVALFLIECLTVGGFVWVFLSK